MKTNKLDAIVIFSMLIAAAVSFYFFFLPVDFYEAENAVGKVIPLSNIVKYRSAKSYVWRDVATTMPISNNDSIYTHDYSTAEIVLDNGVKIAIDERSLFRLNVDAYGASTLFLKRGAIKTQLDKDGVQVDLAGLKATLAGEGSNVILSVGDQSGMVVSLDRAVEVKTVSGPSISIDPSQYATFDQQLKFQEVASFSLDHIYPSDEEVLKVAYNSAGYKINFKFDPLKNLEFKHIEIDRTPLFNNALTKRFTDTSVVIDGVGKYYWRVGALNETGNLIYSTPRSFYIGALYPTVFRSPYNGQVVQELGKNGESAIVNIAFEEEFGIVPHRKFLEVTSPSNEIKKLEIDPSLNFTAITLDQIGDYKLIVKSLIDDLTVESKTLNFKVAKLRPLSIPKVISPLNETTFTYGKISPATIPIEWKRDRSAIRSFIELYDGEKKLLKSFESLSNKHLLTIYESGKYYYRIRSIDDNGHIAQSHFVQFCVVYRDDIQKISVVRNHSDFEFSWDQLGDEQYQFELAFDREFNNIFYLNSVSKPHFSHTFTKRGVFYWRVKSLNSNRTLRNLRYIDAPTPKERIEKIKAEKFKIHFTTFHIGLKYQLLAFFSHMTNVAQADYVAYQTGLKYLDLQDNLGGSLHEIAPLGSSLTYQHDRSNSLYKVNVKYNAKRHHDDIFVDAVSSFAYGKDLKLCAVSGGLLLNARKKVGDDTISSHYRVKPIAFMELNHRSVFKKFHWYQAIQLGVGNSSKLAALGSSLEFQVFANAYFGAGMSYQYDDLKQSSLKSVEAFLSLHYFFAM